MARKKAKPLSVYLNSLPEKKLTLDLQKPNAAIKDYDEGEFETDLVIIGVVIDGQPYVDGFEMEESVKQELRKVMAGESVKVTLIADDMDADSFPSAVLA